MCGGRIERVGGIEKPHQLIALYFDSEKGNDRRVMFLGRLSLMNRGHRN